MRKFLLKIRDNTFTAMQLEVIAREHECWQLRDHIIWNPTPGYSEPAYVDYAAKAHSGINHPFDG